MRLEFEGAGPGSNPRSPTRRGQARSTELRRSVMTVFPGHFALVFRVQHTFVCTVLLYISTIGYDVNEVKRGSRIFLGFLEESKK